MAHNGAKRAYEVETEALLHLVTGYIDTLLPKGFDLGVWMVETDGSLTPKILGHDPRLRSLLVRLPVRTEGDDQPFFADRHQMIEILETVRPYLDPTELDRLKLRTKRFARLQQHRMALDVQSVTT